MQQRALWAAAAAGCLCMLGLGIANADLLVSEKEILRAARVQWLTMKKQTPLDPRPQVQKYAQCVADSIIANLDEPYASMPWEIVVFDDDSTNAFAMPGGKIAVLNGIFKVADSPDALAVVLGHEIAHVTEEHVIERARRESRSEMLTIMGTAATGIPRDLIGQGAAIGLTLPYSRRQETEADAIGLKYMAEAGFDPRASIYLWRNMSSLNKGAPPEFLSDHPSDDKRMDDLVKDLTPALITYNKAQDSGKRPNCHY
jgi:predicted Zn-dependent protease